MSASGAPCEFLTPNRRLASYIDGCRWGRNFRTPAPSGWNCACRPFRRLPV